MAARLLEVPIALVPLIEDDRQFFKACVGLPEPWASARQTPLSHSLCQHVVVARQPLAIGDTGRDPRMNVVTVGYLAVLRDVGDVSVPRVVVTVLCCALIPVAVSIPSLVILAILAGLMCALVAFETMRSREFRRELRAQ